MSSFIMEHFEILSETAKCIAEQFGPNCEVVLHDLTRPYNNTIVAIYNGHVTGRKVGDSGTDRGLAILRGTSKEEDEYCYINYSDSGRMLRSSSKYYRDKTGQIVGSLCINYDITELVSMQNALYQITGFETAGNKENQKPEHEIFAKNVDELIDLLLQEAIAKTGKDINSLSKEDRINIVKYLDEKGAFLIKKSAETVADYLGISRFTIYNYINA